MGVAGAGRHERREASVLNPQFALHYNRALAAERAGHCEDAVHAYHEAIRINPFDVDAQIHLGLMLRELGRDEEANRAFLMALDLQRSAPPRRRKRALHPPPDSAS